MVSIAPIASTSSDCLDVVSLRPTAVLSAINFWIQRPAATTTRMPMSGMTTTQPASS